MKTRKKPENSPGPWTLTKQRAQPAAIAFEHLGLDLTGIVEDHVPSGTAAEFKISQPSLLELIGIDLERFFGLETDNTSNRFGRVDDMKGSVDRFHIHL